MTFPPYINNECWNWPGYLDKDGYGKVYFNGRQGTVHKLMFEFAYPEILQTRTVKICHHCDNRKCFNPLHLFAGSNSDNIKDSANKGNHRNTRKTHCPVGHEYTKENTVLQKGKSGFQRVCRICRTEKNKIYGKHRIW
ncbi:MAG TPA: HNH endonuclease [Candidatus Saccharimonadales bacterium]|jgi:hypothetical protein